MGKDYRHKILAKFKQGLTEAIPENIYSMWNRHNNDWGEFRKNKKDLEIKILNRELEDDIYR